MRRIRVIGVSVGAVPSTFARRLGELLHLLVHHLDAYYFEARMGGKQNAMVKGPN